MKTFLTTLACLLLSFEIFAAASWQNIDEAHRRGGRKLSVGYLRGKVVLVCRDARFAARLEEVWTSFKTKSFVLLAALPSAPADTTFATYEGATRADFEGDFPLFVVDGTGDVLYRGADENKAIETVVSALTDLESPADLAAWKRYLDFEIAYLPGHAYLRLKEFGKKFPQESKAYVPKAKELLALPDVKNLAAFVSFAKKAKDPRAFGVKEKAKRAKYEKIVRDALASERYKPLLESADPRIVQEVKNAQADLVWAAASF